jgi:C4-dicarboxylate-specific signal transduction histidine kinase
MTFPSVLTTGGFAGVGRATAFALAEAGARRVISGRREDVGPVLARELREQTADVYAAAFDTNVPGTQASEALREAQAELAHVNRIATMGQLTASIAHEINQPLAATIINAQAALRWLKADPPDLEEVRQALDSIIASGNRAGEVIGRIRALVNKAPAKRGRLDINEAIREVIALTRREAERTGVKVRTQLSDSLPLIQGDRIQLQQVMLNLVVNAIEATSAVGGGPQDLLITAGTDEAGDILVAVQDSGAGLDPENLEHVFDAFYMTKSGGMGIGLAICHSIIEAHGGRIWAMSNSPRGAIFQFSLPAHQSES